MNSDQNTYVFFSTAWSATNGGINSFNFDLCLAIARAGEKIFVFLQSGAPESDCVDPNISVHVLPTTFGKFDRRSVEFVATTLGEVGRAIWVGHDAISGGAAVFMRNSLGGRSVVFHHMDYSNYHYLKQGESSTKIQTQKHLLKEADIVFGVGPRLHASAKHLRPRHCDTFSIDPGVPTYKRVGNKEFDFRVAICGRLDQTEDKVKNFSAGVKAAVTALSRLPTKRGSVTMIGAPFTDISALRSNRDLGVAINTIPYISSREDYFRELSDADLVLMPSVKEGFGLVAWEALSLGIPVIVSKSSGLYELLQQIGIGHFVSSVDITGMGAIDEANIANHIQACFSSYDSYRSNAELASTHLQSRSWDKSAAKFLALTSGGEYVDGMVINSIAPELDVELSTLRSEEKAIRPKPVALNKDAQSIGFERFEDVLALTAKRRELVFQKSETTDYSQKQKIKFEYWVTFTPQPAYFLYVHHSANLKQVIRRFSQLLKKHGKTVPQNLFVLRRDRGEHNYVHRLVLDSGLEVSVSEYALRDYIWEYCIDDSFKRSGLAEVPRYYIDQKIVSLGGQEAVSARELLVDKLRRSPECNAHLVVAAGGMGKTWLCRSISAELSGGKETDRLVVLIQAESLREYISEVGSAHIHVTSVFELYDLYCRSQPSERQYDRGTFELAVIAGNIVLIVDGLDELSTVLQERFDLAKFLQSVIELSSSLSSSHILLTTRDSLLVDDSDTSRFGIEKYELLGFDDSDWKRYAAKRFRQHQFQEEIVTRLDSVLSATNFADGGGRVVPFFVDVLCNIIEDDAKSGLGQGFNLAKTATPYLSNNETTDHVIHSIFRREVRRQAIDLDIDRLVLLVAELIAQNGENFGIDALRHTLELYFDTRAGALLEKISLNPLFQKGSDFLKLRYDFLQSYFRSIFLIDCVQNESSTIEALNAFAKSNAKESPEVAYLRKFYQNQADVLDDRLFKLIPRFREYARSQDHKRTELGRRAISGLLKIYMSARNFGSAKASEKIIELFPAPASGARTIDGLAVYGEFPPLDFSEMTVMNSKFLDYKNFGRSRFENAKFISCIFENCVDETHVAADLHLAEFDPSCTLGDVDVLVTSARSHHITEEKTLEQECLVFLRCFFKNGVPYDPKPAWIKFSPKIRGLKQKGLEKLVPVYLEVKSRKGADTHYQLSDGFIGSVRNFIDNNYVDASMREFIAFVR